MICPCCHGTGHRVQDDRDGRYGPCCYPGCHCGQVDCCDGLQETPEAKSSSPEDLPTSFAMR